MASNPGRIPAGGRDIIRIEFDTTGYGGKKMTKGFTVYSNDPQTPSFELKISGEVKGFISYSPKYVRFVANEGEILSESVQLKPVDGHSFTINTIRFKNGDYFRYTLKPIGNDPERHGYTLIVQNQVKTAGSYQDFLLIETDSSKKSSLRIPVTAKIKKNTSGVKK